jgi:hypothetical protein
MVKRETLPISKISESSKRIAIATAKTLLAGVGRLPSSVEQMHVGIHYRRALTEIEYGELSPEWCSIPAVHEAGRGLILEENT